MRFTKMHGIGNDYIYVNGAEVSIADPVALSVRISDRHFGVGSDGLVIISPSEKADFRMRMFNADGSEGEMCGNAARCVGKYVYERHLTEKTNVTIETKAGLRVLELHVKDGTVEAVRVNMGEPIFETALIPTTLPGHLRQPLECEGRRFEVTAVSMGNPHCVLFVDDVNDCDFEKIGPMLEKHPAFPAKVNVEFVQVLDKEHLKMRVWERGSGETLACGTGACASLAAAVLCGLADRKAELQLRGGNLQVEWADDGRIYQSGPAAFVCEGEWLGE